MIQTNTGLLMVAYARLRMAGMDNVGDHMVHLVAELPADHAPSDADVLTVLGRLTALFPEHRDTLTAMFMDPLGA
jgi:hypothetical protein